LELKRTRDGEKLGISYIFATRLATFTITKRKTWCIYLSPLHS